MRALFIALLTTGAALAAPPWADAQKDYDDKVAFLRQQAIEDMKDAIYALQKAGGVPNFMIKELDGFKDKGILPILPKLLPISQRYLKERRAADEAFIDLLTERRRTALAKGDIEAAVALRQDIAARRAALADLERQLGAK